jgi:hypothetical protein
MNDKGIKVVYNTLTKRINEKITSFQELYKKIQSLFSLEDKMLSVYVNLFDDLIEITDEKTLQVAFEKHKDAACFKFFIEIAEPAVEDKSQPVESFSITRTQKPNESVSESIKFNESIFEQECATEFIDKIMKNVIARNEQLSTEYFLNVQNVPSEIVLQYRERNDLEIIKQYTKEFITKLFNRIRMKREEEDTYINIKDSPYNNEENSLLKQIDCLMTSKLNKLEEKINDKLNSIAKDKLDRDIDKMGFSICAQLRPDFIDGQNNIIIEGSMIEFVNIDNQRKPVDFIFDDICSICSGNIYKNKYSCCICNNMIVCEKCEEFHDHPLIKFKTREFSNKDDIMNYMLSNNSQKNIQVDKGLFKKLKHLSDNIFETKYKLSINLCSHKLTVRPNKKFKIPVIIANECNHIIPISRIVVISRNNKDLKIKPFTIDTDIERKEKVEIYLECETNNQIKTYDFDLTIYSMNCKVVCDPVNLVIEVNNDNEEELLNQFFIMHPKVLGIDKEEKRVIMNIIRENVSDKHPYVIYNILSKYKWDMGLALAELIE